MNTMTINGLQCQINMPDAPEGEGVHRLPPYDRQDVYVVDDYPACPDNWMHGSSKAASYFLPIRKGKHLWLDFNLNALHGHEVAVMLSVQGVNPITGQHTTRLELEQYENKCPVHEVDFGQDKFCNKCGYKWPAQNYMSTTYIPRGEMWIDGWRNGSGTVRGFLITDEVVRGIAAQTIGEDRVFAIGIAFYLSKAAKPPKTAFIGTLSLDSPDPKKKKYGGPCGQSVGSATKTNEWIPSQKPMERSIYSMSKDSTSRGIMRSASLNSASLSSMAPSECYSNDAPGQFEPDSIELETKFEIGAGAQITQAQFDKTDANRLSFYDPTPAGLVYVNYCSDADFKKIMKAGKRSESFLGALKVGN